MYIMTNADPMRDLIKVYDTQDNTNETVPLSTIAARVRAGKLKVAGVSTALTNDNNQDARYIQQHGVYLSMIESRMSMAKYYVSKGVSREEALRRVGLRR